MPKRWAGAGGARGAAKRTAQASAAVSACGARQVGATAPAHSALDPLLSLEACAAHSLQGRAAREQEQAEAS